MSSVNATSCGAGDTTTEDARNALVERATGAGWRRREQDNIDVYVRDATRVRVIWRGNDAITGGSLFQDDIMNSYSRDLATVTSWLNR
jgi:hypothetical protein